MKTSIPIFIFLLFLSCTKEEDKTEQFSQQVEDNKPITVAFDSVAHFDTTVFHGKMIYDWRNEEVHKPLINLSKTKEGIITPAQTQMIPVYSCTDEFQAYSLGIGKILKENEKKLLPDSVINVIRDTYNQRYTEPVNSILEGFVVFALAEAYKISPANDPGLKGVVFWAQIREDSPIFNIIRNYEKISQDNIYVNVPLIPGHFVLFYKDMQGMYKIIKAGAAG